MKETSKKIKQMISGLGVLWILFLLMIALSFLTEQFMTVNNMLNVSRQVVVTAVLGIGVTFVIITGGIDLSVGSVLAVTAIISAMIVNQTGSAALAFAAAIASGMLIGAAQGFIITRFHVAPFAITLGGMSIFRGVSLLLTNGIPISNMPSQYRWPGAGTIYIGTIAIPVPVIILIFLAVIVAVLLNKTRIGRYIFAIGSNENTARLSGIHVNKYKIITYMISGLCCAIAGILLTGRINSASPSAGDGYEMDAIAAAVIGGTSMAGGEGTISGTIIGALIIQVIQNGLNLMQINAFWQNVAVGAIIIVAIVADGIRIQMMKRKNN